MISPSQRPICMKMSSLHLLEEPTWMVEACQKELNRFLMWWSIYIPYGFECVFSFQSSLFSSLVVIRILYIFLQITWSHELPVVRSLCYIRYVGSIIVFFDWLMKLSLLKKKSIQFNAIYFAHTKKDKTNTYSKSRQKNTFFFFFL